MSKKKLIIINTCRIVIKSGVKGKVLRLVETLRVLVEGLVLHYTMATRELNCNVPDKFQDKKL